MKKILFLLTLLSLFSLSFAQSTTKNTEQSSEIKHDEQTSDSEFDDFDSIFEQASDVEEAVVTPQEEKKGSISIVANDVEIPLHFYGQLESEIGAGYIYDDGKNDATFGVKFQNDLNFSTRIDQTFALKATLRTKFPDDEKDKQWTFDLYEMYFDYVLLGKAYITAGKKVTTWGCVRLFSDTEEFKNDSDALTTNILNDSGKGASMQIRIPFWNCSLTGLALYKGNGSDVSYKDMSLAFSFETILFHTSFNLFGRKYPDADSIVVTKKEDTHKDTTFGAEIKKTIFGFDVYAQGLAFVKDLKKVEEIEDFSKLIFTSGTYRLWETRGPKLGFNAEYQNVYDTKTCEHNNKVAIYGGISKLGKNKDIALAATWKHSIEEKTGKIEPGIIFSDVFPHALWKNGLKIEYGESYETAKITIGTSLLLKLDY